MLKSGTKQRSTASMGASVGASVGARTGPFGAGIGAGFGGAVGYIAGSLLPGCGRSAVTDGGRASTYDRTSDRRGDRRRSDDRASRNRETVTIPVEEA